MDQKLFDTANTNKIPAAIFADTQKAGAVETRWKYYRMDPKAFMQMGILKVRAAPPEAHPKPTPLWLFFAIRSP